MTSPVGDRDSGRNRDKAEFGAPGCANVLAALSGLIWALLFIRAASHYADVAKYGYPDLTGAWDFWVYLPLGLAMGSLFIALAVNILFRSGAVLLIIFSVAALAAVLPYLVMTGGGV